MNNTLLHWGDMSNANANDGDTLLPHDSEVSNIPNSWFQRSASSFSSACEGDNIQDIFKVLSDVELPTQGNSSMDTIIKFLSEPQEDILKCQRHEMARVAAETKGKQEARRKRMRSAEEHNKSERMRRDRIKVKLRALQELIPNCNKSDRASVLDDAIEYLKALKLQVHMMSMGGSYVSPASIQTVQVPAFSPLLQINPGLGFNMGSSELPVMSCSGVPSASRFQVPIFPSQQLPVTATMPVMQPRMATHLVQVPVVPQTSVPTMHSSKASRRTTTSLTRPRRGESH